VWNHGNVNRRNFLLQAVGCAVASSATNASAAVPAEVAITMDDFTLSEAWPHTPAQVNRRLLDLFDKHRLRITLFVKAANVDEPGARRLLNDWVEAGHTIGNHTYSHRPIYARGMTLQEFELDVLHAERLLQGFDTYQRIFRFPALKEGDTLQVRDGIREFLKQHGYCNGRVTIDASDWYYARRLQSRLRVEPAFDICRFKDPYVQHIRDRSLYYDKLARDVLGRSPKHTLLVHYSYLNSEFLEDVLGMYRALNWRVINSSDAFRDPVFRAELNTLPAGESLIWALAKQTGRYEESLRYPGEDDTYEKPKLDRLGL
jgi:peptidoglycan-N-acetylglucosamine deacetylase